MLLKLLLKIWPALIPIILYVIWILFFKKKARESSKTKIIDGEFREINEGPKSNNDFSLKDPKFIATVYLSLITAIICFLIFAITSNSNKSNHGLPLKSVEEN